MAKSIEIKLSLVQARQLIELLKAEDSEFTRWLKGCLADWLKYNE